MEKRGEKACIKRGNIVEDNIQVKVISIDETFPVLLGLLAKVGDKIVTVFVFFQSGEGHLDDGVGGSEGRDEGRMEEVSTDRKDGDEER